ncbi:MAG: hypothetical protein L0220_10715 [Acidobacteria bacterium]|nr:hypothetical protein [Acidobacteriota bacterium]
MPLSLCKIGKFFLPVIFGLIFLYSQAYACTCPPINSPEVEKKQANTIFSGKVVNANASDRKLRIDLRFPFIHFIEWRTRIEFSVKEVWKGQASPELGIITFGSHGCNFNFKEGDEYIVYAYGNDKDDLYTHRCTRTALLIDANEDLTQLGIGRRPEHPSLKSALPAIGSLFLAIALPVLILYIYCLNRRKQREE